jgi:MoaA/NifB/PqqE/SkfB family radical SAM enzyme/glycosyltransferase involved in cell wall biosynthesis
MNTGQTFSYIVPFRNARATIVRTVASILSQNNVLELILVDDQSTDGTKDALQALEKDNPKIHYIRNEKQQGAGLSRNTGARATKGDVLVFVDADVVLPSGTGEILLEYFRGYKIQPVPDMIVGNRAKEELDKGWASQYKNYWTSYNLSKLKGWTSFLGSSFAAVGKNVFMSVNGFRNMPSAEDSDLGYRLIKNGYKIYFAEDIKVLHSKKFSVFSLLKREFKAGREGIKVAVNSKVLCDLAREKKFFAVNENFIYSFPLAAVFTLGVLSGFLFSNPVWGLIASLSFLVMTLLNQDFLAYASQQRHPLRSGVYIFFMALQLNAIGLGMGLGLSEWFFGKIKATVIFAAARGDSFRKLFLKYKIAPEQVTFFLTHRCNLTCPHCFLGEGKSFPGRELSLNEMDRMTKNMPKVKYVTVTGGEPFLREDVVETVGVLHKNLKPVLITLLTNGYDTGAVVGGARRILEQCSPTSISIKLSLDGPPGVHDAMRQRAGAFERTQESFFRLKKLKQLYQNLSVGILTTYTHQNKGQIPMFFETEILKMRPDQYSLVLERPAQASKLNDAIQVDEYISLLKEINSRYFHLTQSFSEKFRLAYKMRMTEKIKKIFTEKKYPMSCFAGTLNAIISADGNVFACEQLSEPFGNLREANFDWEKIWWSPQAEKTRDFIRRRACFCTNECFMPFNLLYNPRELPGVFWTFIKISRQKDKDHEFHNKS